MKEKKIILLDRDDTLYSCNKQALEMLSAETGEKYDYYRIDRWGLLGNALDGRLKYFSDPDFVRGQKLYRGAKAFVTELQKRGYEVMICTNVPSAVCPAVMESVMRDFPSLKPENVIFGARKDLITADYALDDSVANIQGWQGSVKYPVLFRQPWNLSESGGLSVSSYEGFLNMLDVIENPGYTGKPDGVILVGPSGANKTAAAAEFEKRGFTRVRSYSTRKDDAYIHTPKKDFEGNKGGFIEISHYAGNYYALKADDIDGLLAKGKKPLLVLDINGAVSLRHRYNFVTCFVQETKENCIRNILKKQFSEEETVKRICGLDREFACAGLCDTVYTGPESVQGLAGKEKKRQEN